MRTSWVLLVLLSFATPPIVNASEYLHPAVSGSFLSSSGESPSSGGEIQATLLAHPFIDHWMTVGPRVGLVRFSETRASVGVETTLWALNAIGPGLALDRVLGQEWRGELKLGARILHLGEGGALSVQGGILQGSHTGRGLRVGLTWEWSGVE